MISRRGAWPGVAVSLLCLALAARGVQWGEVWRQMVRADPVPLVASASLVVALMGARASRWGVLLMGLRGGADWPKLFAVVNIGYMANNVLPARVGDLVRAHLWGEWTGASRAASLSTVAVERLLDLLACFVCVLLLLPFVNLPDWALWSGLGTGGIGLLLLALFATVARQQVLALRAVAWVMQRFPVLSGLRLESLALSLLDGFAVLQKPSRGGAIALWTAAIWAGQSVYNLAILAALGLQTPFVSAIAVMTFGSLSIALPSAPGGVGVFHFVVVLTLALFGVEREPALGAALLMHGMSYIVVTSMGLLFAWQSSVPWSRLRRLSGAVENGGARERAW